jgi:hypothetical protein
MTPPTMAERTRHDGLGQHGPTRLLPARAAPAVVPAEPAPTTLYSTASAARRGLGFSTSGAEHLPRSHGRLRLASSVGTDWHRFRRLASSGSELEWLDALALIRGRPFEGLARVDWTVLEGFAASIEDQVSDLAVRVAERRLAAGSVREAAAAARRGLKASPYDERLYRVLLRCADADGHPAGVESVMAELVSSVDGIRPDVSERGLDLRGVHPKTASLYRALSRRGPEAKTAVARQ